VVYGVGSGTNGVSASSIYTPATAFQVPAPRLT